jgi:hypothetical protein
VVKAWDINGRAIRARRLYLPVCPFVVPYDTIHGIARSSPLSPISI